MDVRCCGCESDGRLCRGCSVCVAVVGEDAFELVSASDAALDETEKYADVGVGVTVVWYAEELGGTGLVCTVGRVGGDPWTFLGGEPGSELLKRRLLLFPTPVGLGLRLLRRDVGLVNPLWYAGSSGAGVTMEMASKSSSSGSFEVRTAAALSSTEGTERSISSVNFARAVWCGSAQSGMGELMGSMSRSKIAEEEEWLSEDKRGSRWCADGYLHRRRRRRDRGG